MNMNFDKLFQELRSLTKKAHELKGIIESEKSIFEDFVKHSNYPNMDSATATRYIFMKGDIDKKIFEFKQLEKRFEDAKNNAIQLLAETGDGVQVSDNYMSVHPSTETTITMKIVDGKLSVSGIRWPSL